MASIFNVQLKTIPSRGDADLIGPLAFSLMGLLTHCVALLMQNEPSLASLQFTLIVSAAPVAALGASRFTDSADEFVR
jgi:hypothetical protein